MRLSLTLARFAAVAVVVAATACAGDDGGGGPAGESGRPRIVVTTSILGDVVTQVVGPLADVEVVMPLGADPHEFAPSTRQAEAMASADLLVVNGAGFEEGMVELIERVEQAGTPTFALADHVELLGSDTDHADDVDHADDADPAADADPATDAGDHPGADPHVWTDPVRLAGAVGVLAERLAAVDGVDAAELAARADAYVAELEALDADIEARLSSIPAERRVLVTNHEVFAYFADRYGFTVLGAVVPSLTTNAEASAADLDALANLIREAGVPAIFAETTRSAQLADALADEVGADVRVVELHTESLGEPGSGAETYVEMLRTDAELIAEALA